MASTKKAEKVEKEPVTALEKKGDTSIAAFEYDEDDIGAGFEHQTKADSSIPFVVLLQALSPIVAGGESEAKAGNWFNTVTEQIWGKEGFLFVPSTTRHVFGEWTPRDEGGGFHGNHEVDSPVVREAMANGARIGKMKLSNGHDLVECFYVYGVICSEAGEPESMGVMAFNSTKIRSYKAWNTRLKQFVASTPNGRVRVPMYAHLTRVVSELKKNDKGTFYIPTLKSAIDGGLQASLLSKDDERFQAAKQLKQLVDSGDAKIDPNQQNNGGETAGEESPF